MVNSGSSANLLALSSFGFKKGSEIITPTLTFSTTVSPIYQIGCIPHFIDVEKFSFLSDLDQIEKAINNKTVAIMLPNLLGNVINWKKVYRIAKKYDIKIIEDSADTIGYSYKGKNLENIRMLQQIVFTLRILLLEQDLEGLRALMIKNIMKELNY